MEKSSEDDKMLPPADNTGQKDEGPKIIFFKPENQYYYFIESQLQIRKGKTDKSLYFLEKAIEKDPESFYLYKELVNLFLHRKENRKALDIVEKLLKKEPDSLEYMIIHGKLKQSLGDIQEAKEEYEKILAKDPKQNDIYMLLGNLYMEDEDMDNAFRIYGQLVRHFPESYAGHFFLGKLYAEKGNLKEAEKSFQKTLELKPILKNPGLNYWISMKYGGIKKRLSRCIRIFLKKTLKISERLWGWDIFTIKTAESRKLKKSLKNLGRKVFPIQRC